MPEVTQPSERTLDERIQDLEDYINASSPPPDEVSRQLPGDGFHGTTYHHLGDVHFMGASVIGLVVIGLGMASLAGLLAAFMIFRNAARNGNGVK